MVNHLTISHILYFDFIVVFLAKPEMMSQYLVHSL